MVRKLVVLVFVFTLASACGLSESNAQEKDNKEKAGTVIGELKSRKDVNNGKSAIIEILGDGEEKARAYYVVENPKADPKAKDAFAELLKAVKTAQVGDRVRIDWHRPENAEGNFFVRAFEVLKKADAKRDDGTAEKQPQPAIRLSEDDAATRDKVLERMAHHKVPGMSMAVVHDGRIVFARGYGVVEAGGAKAVTDQTRFQAASISKPVTALAALLLVQQKKLELDDDLNQRLVSWKIPDNEFTEKKRVTLRQVLSHSAGFTVHGFRGYAAGAEVPSLLQVLDGTAPANSPAIRVDLLPGSKVRYSGGGFCVLQQVLIDVSGSSFPALMHELVLAPLKMDSSSFAQPTPKGFDAAAAAGHVKGEAVSGKWHTYPELAPSGLWTTPSDLARFVIGVQRARRGHQGAVLSAELTAQMLTPQTADRGLGFKLEGKDKARRFAHGGANEGFTCLLVGAVENGQGAVIMTNGHHALALIDEMMQHIRREYGWGD